MKPKEHWNRIYSGKTSAEMSWFQEHAECSLGLIQNMEIPTTASVIDVGGGESTLVDGLLAHGYNNITVLDLAKTALNKAKARLGKDAQKVKWLESNILDYEMPTHLYDVWHDRAVFHFLINNKDRQAYVNKVIQAVKPGGIVIMATFAKDGPTECSGLPVMRYTASELHNEFGGRFDMLDQITESHYTPDGNEQKFIYCLYKVVVNER
tara:strand:+ start:1939 stop:2565 length:627 start_codon:yes stop_codon:yes gene_type:complete